jgi:hypothetical protein
VAVQRGRTGDLTPGSSNNGSETHTYSLDDIVDVEPNGAEKNPTEENHAPESTRSIAQVQTDSSDQGEGASDARTKERAELITEFVLYLIMGTTAVLFTLWPLLKKARSLLHSGRQGGPKRLP